MKKRSFMKRCAFLLGSFFLSALHAANPSSVRIVPVTPTPEADNVQLIWTLPKDSQIVGQPVRLKMNIDGFPLGTLSDFPRRNEIAEDPDGQSVRIIVDEYPPISIYVSVVDGLNDSNIFYNQRLATTVPYGLPNGTHLIRAFPVRSYGESLKGAGCFVASVFYTGGFTFPIDLSAPFLTYNVPRGNLPYGKPVLLDFYISNTRLSEDGYKVQMTLDGTIERTLTKWIPYYIYGLERGTHTVRLQLLDENNTAVPGPTNDVEKEFTLY
jgi:hypothetical protein